MILNRFAKYSWFVVAYNVLVILWGAFVRASGSGAGCGSHWPLCNGEVVPLNPSIERVIEFTHRGMSGIALLLVLGMVIWAVRVYPRGRVRYGAFASGAFILLEALIGAALVVFGWVGVDKSVARIISIALHLVNTFLLLAVLSLTAWWASGGAPVLLRERPRYTFVILLALLGLVITGAAGALTALGDTLFPASSLAEGMAQDASPTAHFLVQLRVVHPVIAAFVGMYLFTLTMFLNGVENSSTRKFAVWLRTLVIVQLSAGGANILLLAPTWMQLVHLLLADGVWLLTVLYAASLLAEQHENAREPTRETRALTSATEL